MSVSLALLPVALVLRLAMGKEGFEKWVESSQVRHVTNFRNQQELIRVVRQAGYDAQIWGGSVKTHIDGERLFFFWELIDGKWTAVFGKSDPEHLVRKLMADVNRAAGRNVFASNAEQQRVKAPAAREAVRPQPPSVFPTNFRDMDLLQRTLKDFGANPVRQGGALECRVEHTRLVFRQHQESGPIHVEVHNPPDMRKVFEYLSNLDDDYKRCLQSAVYERLKARVGERNMTIESEEVMEDNSIVLTINVNG